MRKRKWIVIDLSSVLKRCYFAGKDTENGFEVEFEGKKHWINSWMYGRSNFLNHMESLLQDTAAMPMDCIFVLEGKHGAELRRNIFNGYKRRPPRPPENGTEYEILEQWVTRYFQKLGSLFVRQDGLEADDVVAYLSRHLKGEIIVNMDDGDGLILDDGERVRVRYQSQMVKHGENPLGPFDLKFNRLYKSLVGDKSDTLPGAKGFGEGAFIEIFAAVQDEGMIELEKLIDSGNWAEIEKDAATCLNDPDLKKVGKALQKLLDHRDDVRRCYKCAGFMDHLVNTPNRAELEWLPGSIVLEKPEDEMTHEFFDTFRQQRRLVTKKNFAEIMASSIWAKIRKSPFLALDLETTTPVESDDWLREVNKQREDDEPKGVDVIASTITGMGLTFGENGQYTLYFSVDHAQTENITPEQLFLFLDKIIKEDPEITFTVHNSAFELPVLFNNLNEFTADRSGWDQGFLPRVEDSLFMASYVDENEKIGLKAQSLLRLGYEQTSYEDTVWSEEEQRHRKMHELSGREVFNYGTDDTIVTFALRNLYEAIMQIEDTWRVYAEVEMPAAYLCSAAFVTGIEFNREEMRRQEEIDDEAYDAAWGRVREYLVKLGWEGVHMPEVTLEAASIKSVWNMVTGTDLETRARTPSKIVAIMSDETAEGAHLKALYERACETGDTAAITEYARGYFKGEPQLNTDSPTQMNKLFYESMGLPIRVRNKPTAQMRAKKIEGSPKTDSLAIATARYYDKKDHPEAVAMLDDFHTMKSVNTRRKLFYRPYKTFKHWKTGRIHGSMGQCFTATRRFAPHKPNLSQLPSDPKKGDFRANFEPHHKRAVVVSCDFNAQELRLIADSSQDEAMLSCYVGENKRDMHHLTALKIVQSEISADINYEHFAAVIAAEEGEDFAPFAAARKKAKTVNFASEYGAQGPKMAETLMVPLEVAESYLDAKHSTFWRAEEWKKDEVIPRAKKKGYALTRMGARRHLARAFNADDWGTRSRAERQAVNFEVQGSCGEQTKLAMGRIWKSGILSTHDVQFMMPVHDEIVFSVGVNDALEVVPLIHGAMEVQYADMSVPCRSSIGLGRNFRHLVEIGMEAKPELIVGALNKLFPEETFHV